MAFWKPDPDDPARIVRAAGRRGRRAPAISEFPHLIVNQARVLDYFAEFAANAPSRMKPDYGWEFVGLEVEDDGGVPGARDAACARAGRATGRGARRAREVRRRLPTARAAGCARRSARKHVGDQAYHAWGVMDVLAVTDFPDIRTKCAIQSRRRATSCSSRARAATSSACTSTSARCRRTTTAAVRKTTLDEIIAKANDILHPYTLDVKDVAWHSVYEVGHRVTDRFDDVPLELIGDRDAARVHRRRRVPHPQRQGRPGHERVDAGRLQPRLEARPGARRAAAPSRCSRPTRPSARSIAQNLIDFDQEWSTLMAQEARGVREPLGARGLLRRRRAEFPAGFMTQYTPSMIVGERTHQAARDRASRSASASSRRRVARVADGNDVHLGHHHRADGRWRVYAFADAPAPGEASALARLGGVDGELAATRPSRRTRRRAPTSTASSTSRSSTRSRHGDIDLGRVPGSVPARASGPFGLIDYEKVYAVLPDEDIFDVRGIDRARVRRRRAPRPVRRDTCCRSPRRTSSRRSSRSSCCRRRSRPSSAEASFQTARRSPQHRPRCT